MKRRFIKHPVLGSTEIDTVRIKDGENFNDSALGNRISEYIYSNGLIDDADTLINEAAEYYANLDGPRSHNYNKIVKTAKDDLEYSIQESKASAMSTNYEVYGFHENIVDTGSDSNEETKATNDPEEAITAWFQISQKYPLCTAICGKDKESAEELLQFAAGNADLINRLCRTYRVSYGASYLNTEIDNMLTRGYTGGSDQIHPFSFG